MTVRRFTAVAIAASSVGIFCASPAFAGLQAPKDMVATPSVGPIGQHILISNGGSSPCGGQEGDGPTPVDVTITKPDSTVLPPATAFPDQDGDWTIGFLDTNLAGVYQVTAFCADVVTPPEGLSSALATDFSYTPTSFTIQAAQVTTTTTSTSTTTSTTTAPTTTTSTIAATTTTTAAAQPAVAAAVTPTFTG